MLGQLRASAAVRRPLESYCHRRVRRSLVLYNCASPEVNQQAGEQEPYPRVAAHRENDLISELASLPGVRIVRSAAAGDDDDDEDDWEEVMSELANPWDMPAPPEDDQRPAVVGGTVGSTTPAPIPTISRQQLEQLRAAEGSRLVLLDVRTPDEYQAYHQGDLGNTRNIPLYELGPAAQSLAELSIVVMATGDHRALQAARRLAHVYHIQQVWLCAEDQ